jgi:hypothetical protein
MKFFQTKSSGYINLHQVVRMEHGDKGLTLFLFDGTYRNLGQDEADKLIPYLIAQDAIIRIP